MTTALQKSAQENLKRSIEAIERLQDDQKALAGDIRDKFAELKSVGFDVKAIRKILKMRKQSQSEREDEEAILEVYMSALGMLGTPMGDYLGELDRQEQLVD